MNNLKIFCISLSESHLEKIKKINYIPVGLGSEFFSKDWLRDNSGDNISEKAVNVILAVFAIVLGFVLYKTDKRLTFIQMLGQ